MNRADVTHNDPSNMAELIRAFPGHIDEAVRIGMSQKISVKTGGVRSIVVTGLGGSAIGGDLLRCFLADELSVPLIVNRSYELPEFVGSSTLVIVSSYSGNTEETVAAHREALKRKARILAISSDGTTAAMAKRNRDACLTIPAGFPPRAALAYSFFPLLIALWRLGFVAPKTRAIAETVAVLSELSERYGDVEARANRALEVATTLHGTIPVIYSPSHLEAVNLRWRGQIAENAKQLAYGNVIPEMNHNEIVGWKALPHLLKSFSVVFLADRETHRRVRPRMLYTDEVLRSRAASVSVVESVGRSRLARTFSLVHTGDWVSLYLAILNREDPTPVRVIDALKHRLQTV